MSKALNILMIEPSEIISAGIKQLLQTQDLIRYFKSYKSIKEYKSTENFERNYDLWDIVIVNPQALNVINQPKKVLSSLFHTAYLLGFVSNYYDRKYQNVFTEYIFLNDSSEILISHIENYASTHSDNIKDEKALSKRELEVLKCLIKGDSIKEISSELNISNHTALTHRRNISAKIGVKSVAAMAIYAVATNIIDPKDTLTDLR